MKHKHVEMIKAKVDDMNLVLLVKGVGGWKESLCELPQDRENQYFLCHPKHTDQAIHWLNGGKTQFCPSDRFFNMSGFNENKWHPNHTFMDKDLETRIKPKKEKRWIFVDTRVGVGVNHCSDAHFSKEDLMGRIRGWVGEYGSVDDVQIIEIEIEVE